MGVSNSPMANQLALIFQSCPDAASDPAKCRGKGLAYGHGDRPPSHVTIKRDYRDQGQRLTTRSDGLINSGNESDQHQYRH